MKREKSSGNIFADFGLENAEELQLRSDLACVILKIQKNRKITQQQLAEILGTQQSEISALNCGDMERFTIGRLFKFLRRLGRDIEVGVKRTDDSNEIGQVSFTGV